MNKSGPCRKSLYTYTYTYIYIYIVIGIHSYILSFLKERFMVGGGVKPCEQVGPLQEVLRTRHFGAYRGSFPKPLTLRSSLQFFFGPGILRGFRL